MGEDMGHLTLGKHPFRFERRTGHRVIRIISRVCIRPSGGRKPEHTSKHAAFRPCLQIGQPIDIQRDKGNAAPRRFGFLRSFHGKGFLRAGFVRGTAIGKRTAKTAGVLRRADGIGEIHQRLREIRRPFVWPHFVIQGTDLGLRCGQRRVHGEIAGHDPFDIAIYNDAWLAKGNGGNRAGGIGPDPGKRTKPFDALREHPAMIGADRLSRAMQIASPRIIAQPGPCRHHILAWCGGKVADRRPSTSELEEIRYHSGDNGLLQHDFRQPHMVGRRQVGPAPPPGKRAAVTVVPVKNL